MDIRQFKEKITETRVLFLIILGIAVYLRMINILSEQLWHDEGGTIHYVTSSWQHLYRKVTDEKNPILYYTILKLWFHLFGGSVLAFRTLSVIFSILIVPLLFLIGKEVKDEKLGLIISFLFAISPFSIWYANEVRMYSFLQLLFAIDFYFAIKILKNPNITKNYVFFSISSVCLIYTHYIGVVYLTVLGFGIFLYNRKTDLFWKNSFISIIIILVGYIPWMPHAISDVLEGPTAYTGGVLNPLNLAYWAFYIFVAPVPSFIHIPYVVNMIILALLINLPLLILSSIALIGFLYSYKNKDYFNLKIIINFTILTIILIFGIQILIGIIIPNTFQSKNLIGGLIPIYLIEGFGLYYLFIDKGSSFNQNLKRLFKIINPKVLRRIMYPLFISVLLCSVIIFPIFKMQYLQKPDWNGCVKTLKKEYKSHDIVINQYGMNQLPEVMAYYSDLHDFDFDENTYNLLYEDKYIEEFWEYVEDEEINRVWIVSYWKETVDPDDKTVDKLEDGYGYELEKIEKYEFRLDLTLRLYELHATP